MCIKETLDKAMESIALGYIGGDVTIDFAIKACESYHEKLPQDDQFAYDLIVSKSCIDYINGLPKDEELDKAIVPFQTKVIDGVMYIYSPTKVGSKVQYDWHVVQRGKKTQKDIGRGSKLSQQELAASYKMINSLFPNDINSVKAINMQIGGSTGAKLVQDVNGTKFVMKRGDASSYTNNGHVKNEYLSAQLYSMMGQNTPSLELYEENGVQVTLSKFIPLTHTPNPSDYANMAKGFIADCLMANWDVYKNDNCLIDSTGKVYRVDNGGCLNYRAQGSTKTFDSDILKTFNSMVQYNPAQYQTLSRKDILAQIAEIRKRKDDIVNFLRESGEDSLADIMSKRIDNLSQIENQLGQSGNIEDIAIPKNRKLKPEKQMYRTFTQKELDDIWNSVKGNTATDKIYRALNSHDSYDLLGKICAARGFDGLPEVVTLKEFFQKHSGSERQLFRGITKKSPPKPSLFQMEKNLLFDDGSSLYYGNPDGASCYGEGLYFHKNDGANAGTTSSTFRNGEGYKHAVRYANKAGNSSGVVFTGCLSDDANVVDFESLRKEILSLNLSKDPKSYAKQQKVVNTLNEEIKAVEFKIQNFEKALRARVYKDMKFDEDAYADMKDTLVDGIDWGKVTPFGDRDIPSFKDMVETKLVEYVKKQGGSAVIGHNTVTFKLPNSRRECVISSTMYDGDYSIYQDNPVAPAHNYAIDKFLDWVDDNHLFPVQRRLSEETENSVTKVQALQSELYKLRTQRNDEEDKLQKMMKVDGTESILHGIYYHLKHGYEGDAAVGVYAALKGYDAIEVDFHGNAGRSANNNFYVVLNRTKLVLANSVDNV